MNILAFLLLSFLIQDSRLGSVEGSVTRAGTTQPVANAVVELGGDNKSEPLAVATTADGKFQFRNVTPGRYRLTVTRDGYLPGGYGQRGPNGSVTTLPVAAGQALKDVRLNMIPTGTLSGRIYGSSGEPQANVPVNALKYTYVEGQRTLSLIKTDITDDRGEYRLFWLPPGQYYINAAPNGPSGDGFVATARGIVRASFVTMDSHVGAVTGRGSAEPKLGEADAPVFYPGTAEPQSATSLDLRPGADIGGLDFTLTRVKTRKLRGRVVDPTGQPATNPLVVLVSRTPSAIGAINGRPLEPGAFEIDNVLPGSYFLVATQRRAVQDAAVTSGRIAVDVGTADLDQLTITLSPGIEMPGTITVEGRGERPEHPIVVLNSADFPGRPRESFATFNGDRFTVEDVLEGEYRVEVIDVPKTAYVKSIRFGATDALNDTLRIDSRSSERLDIVISFNAGGVEGSVVGKDGKPMSNTSVTLVPNGAPLQRDDLYKRTSTDEAGRFHFDGIAPGQYSAFAWEDIDDSLWRDPDFLRRNSALGKLIAIREGSRESVELTAIPFVY